MANTTQTPPFIKAFVGNPNGFLRNTEVWCLPKAHASKSSDPTSEPDPIVVTTDDSPKGSYPADASFIAKIVLARGTKPGEKWMFLSSTGIHSIVEFMEAIRSLDFDNKVKFGMHGHTKAEFSAPATPKHAYVIQTVPRGEGKYEDLNAFVIPPVELLDADGEMIMMARSNEGEDRQDPDWVLSWSFLVSKNGPSIIALTAGGKTLELVMKTGGGYNHFRDITPAGMFVNDVVTLPVPNGAPELIMGTNKGVYHKGGLLMGTGPLNVANLCFDVDSGRLWVRTRDNRIYAMWHEGGRFQAPEPWSSTPMIFQDQVSHRLLGGAGIANPILTSWGKPRQNGFGKLDIEYSRMEIPKHITPTPPPVTDVAPFKRPRC